MAGEQPGDPVGLCAAVGHQQQAGLRAGALPPGAQPQFRLQVAERGIQGAGQEQLIRRLVEQLVREGRQIYGVRVLATSLEEEYLEAVGGDTA